MTYKLIRNSAFFALCAMFCFSVQAQMFAPENDVSAQKSQNDTSISSQQNNDWGRFYNQTKNSDGQKSENVKEDREPSQKETVSSLKPPAKQDVQNPEDYIYKNIPQIERPTLDGVKRGRTSVVPVVQNRQVAAEGYIYIFYSDFSVRSMMNGSTSCDVKFQILTTLDRRLNSLAVRLKWPTMETPLTFLDVNPNQQYHFIYTLLGDGCYSMDKVPNIIINRCRIKGMSQEECARKVRWIRKVN